MVKEKFARRSFGEPYKCKKDWDEDCFVQCGDSGLVLKAENTYNTAFFEAFPTNPKTFIRGEGETIQEAEERAFEKLQKYKKCEKHEFERNGYTNGAGFCKHCGLFKSKCFEPSTTCVICNKPTNWGYDVNKEWYCKKHIHLMPYEKMHSYQQEDFDSKRTEKITKLEHFNYLEDREYYLKETPNELKHLEEFMKGIFKELSLNMGFSNIKTADIKEKYALAVKNFGISINMFRKQHEYVDYRIYEKDSIKLISIRFNEQEEISEEDSNEEVYVKTGREIYLFSLDTKNMINLLKIYNVNL